MANARQKHQMFCKWSRVALFCPQQTGSLSVHMCNLTVGRRVLKLQADSKQQTAAGRPAANRDTMTITKVSHSRMAVTDVEEFLRNPPAGFSVEVLPSGYRVHSDPEDSLVLIDGFESCRGTVVFHKSLGRWGENSTLCRLNIIQHKLYLNRNI